MALKRDVQKIMRAAARTDSRTDKIVNVKLRVFRSKDPKLAGRYVVWACFRKLGKGIDRAKRMCTSGNGSTPTEAVRKALQGLARGLR